MQSPSTSKHAPLLDHSALTPDPVGVVGPKLDDEDLGDRCPSELGGFWSKVFFSWIVPLMKLGNKRPLENEDLYQLDRHNQAAVISDAFQVQWDNERRKAKPSIAWTLARAFGFKFMIAGGLKLIHDTLQFVSPMIINRIIAFLSDPEAKMSTGVIYAAVVLVSGVIQSFALRQYFFYCSQTGMQLRSAVVTAVLEKALVLSAAARQKRTTGEITNLMSIDAQRLQALTPNLHAVWYAPYQIIWACVLLWHQIGVATFAGIAVIILVMAAMGFIAKGMRKLQMQLMQVKDERIKVCNEVLSGMKVIKMKAWENSFVDRVMGFRQRELNRLKIYTTAQSATDALFTLVPALVTTMSFMAYVLMGHRLDVATAITSLSLFAILRFPLYMLPQMINNLIEASVSFQRLSEFLLDEERIGVTAGDLVDVGICVENADFEWDSVAPTVDSKQEEVTAVTTNSGNADVSEDLSAPAQHNNSKPILQNISFAARSGELHAIVGQVGCGKSTLLAGLLGDARCSAGRVTKRGSTAYVAQQPFIQNASVRENICFGLPYEPDRYKEAVRVSCLHKDLQILPAGDKTEIGEKGINLSGGQRTRVALARAVYQDADIYIFDDILSAVDSHVGSKIFENCIKRKLKDKLVVLVTHSLTFLNQCNKIVVLECGKIVESGGYDVLMTQNGVLAQMIANYVKSDKKDGIEEETVDENVAEKCDAVAEPKPTRFDRSSRASSVMSDGEPTASAKLMVVEDRSTGDVKWSVYRTWIKASGGWPMALFVLTLYVSMQVINLLSTLWISYWSNESDKHKHDQVYYSNIYAGINAVFAVVAFARVIAMYAGSRRSSRVLFSKLISRIMRAPISFFDTTPQGRIVNRLSKDVYTADEDVPISWNDLFDTVLSVVVTIITIATVTPWFLIVLFPVMFIYYTAQRFYIKTSRELQRLESVSRSPIFALLAETLDGISTIRAYQVEGKFIGQTRKLLDQNQRSYFLNFAVNCWLSLHLEFAGALIAAGAALTSVLNHNSNDAAAGRRFASIAGVALSYAFNVTQMLTWTVRSFSQLQTQMVSVERIQTYTEMDTEASLTSTANMKSSLDWPNAGAITFDKVSLRYRPGLPRVLDSLSFQVNPHEKVGIVGRTGAGKSSLMVALMRIAELDQGRIMIDGVDIGAIGLHDLRANIAIIPQDPVLFSGTIRFNLDPFNEFTDDQIWVSIKRAQLSNAVSSLDAEVDEQGSNFSVGERQLLSIARALLNRSKVILMDEATASIDTETDSKIQQSIREEFKDCTCLTIAHRINTILDSDRILVMDKGHVAEYAPPDELLKIPDGIFKSLVDHWRMTQDQD